MASKPIEHGKLQVSVFDGGFYERKVILDSLGLLCGIFLGC